MNIALWVIVLVVFACLPSLLALTGRWPQGHLPRDFDFGSYKRRELNLRGLFDKTKWK